MYANNEEMPDAYLYKPYDGGPAAWGNGTHTALVAETRAEVDSFYRAAMKFEGLDEGAPGVRDNHAAGDYAAYLRDPARNKLQAVYCGDA